METLITVTVKFYHERESLTKEEMIEYLDDHLDECPSIDRLNDTVTVSYNVVSVKNITSKVL